MAQPQPLATSTTPLSVSMHVTALGMSWKWNHEVFVSCDLHFSLPVVSSGLIHAVMSVRTSFLRPNNSPLYVHVLGVSIQPLIHWLSCFTLAAVNGAAVSVGVQIAVRSTFVSFGCIPGRITGAHAGSSVPTLWKNHHTVVFSNSTRIPASAHPLPHVLFLFLFGLLIVVML